MAADWQITQAAVHNKRNEELEQWRRTAFIPFQIGGKEGQSFGDYLKAVGIKSQAVATKEPKNDKAKKAIKNALKIKRADRRSSNR